MAKVIHKTVSRLPAIATAVLLTVLIFAGPVRADTIEVLDGASLIEQAKSLNGQMVNYRGEVIGDIMPRQDHYWINVLNNGTAMGIWITAEQRAGVDFAGRYGIRGDKVEVVGQFNRACAEHGGDMDIHAVSLIVIEPGAAIARELNINRLAAAGMLLLLASASLAMLIRLRFKNSLSKH